MQITFTVASESPKSAARDTLDAVFQAVAKQRENCRTNPIYTSQRERSGRLAAFDDILSLLGSITIA